MIRVLQTHPEACCECVQVLWIVWQVLCKCDTGEREPWPGEEVRPVFKQERIMITGLKVTFLLLLAEKQGEEGLLSWQARSRMQAGGERQAERGEASRDHSCSGWLMFFQIERLHSGVPVTN